MSNPLSKADPLQKRVLDHSWQMKLVVISVCMAVLYYPVFLGLVADWIDLPDLSHGFLVPLVSLYLVWERRTQLLNTPACPANWGLFILIAGIGLLLLGTLATEFFTMRFSLLMVLAGTIVFMLGWGHFKILVFPLAFLVFMIPIPSIFMQKISFPLQVIASSFSTSLLQQIGIPVLRDGNILQLPNGTLHVVEACSGIRSLITLLALGTVFAYIAGKIFWERALLVAACVPIAIVVNGCRVAVTGVLAYNYGMAMAEGFFHGFSGYLMFLFALALLFVLNLCMSGLRRIVKAPR